jgi:hypothetical protein
MVTMILALIAAQLKEFRCYSLATGGHFKVPN